MGRLWRKRTAYSKTEVIVISAHSGMMKNGIDYMACSMVSTVPSTSPAAHDLDGILIQALRWDKAEPDMETRVVRKH